MKNNCKATSTSKLNTNVEGGMRMIVAEYKLGETTIRVADDYLPKTEEEYAMAKSRIDATASRIWEEVCKR